MMGDEGPSKTLANKEKLESCQRELAKTLKQLANAERKRDKTQNYNRQLIEEVGLCFPVMQSSIFYLHKVIQIG